MRKIKSKEQKHFNTNSVKTHIKNVKRKKQNKRNKTIRRQIATNNSSKFITTGTHKKEITLPLPSEFSLDKDLQKVINFISILKSYKNVSHEVWSIILDKKKTHHV